jgi:hypothetical protein
MAIKCKFTSLHGVDLLESYANIQQPQLINKRKTERTNFNCSATVYFYANQEAYEANKVPVEGKGLYREVDLKENILEQMYNYLKEQEYITESEDC